MLQRLAIACLDIGLMAQLLLNRGLDQAVMLLVDGAEVLPDGRVVRDRERRLLSHGPFIDLILVKVHRMRHGFSSHKLGRWGACTDLCNTQPDWGSSSG